MSIGVIIAYILAALGAGIVLVHIVVAAGTVATRIKEGGLLRRAGDVAAEVPSVSVIVPARNEQYALPRLFASFDAQESGEFEVVLVNDRSSDQTAEVMEDYRSRHPDSVQVVTLTEAPEGGNPKQNALAHGAEAAGGEILLLTDADCVVPPQWISRMSRYLADPRVGLVFGPVLPDDLSRWLSQYQSFDHVFRYLYTAGSAGLGSPAGGFGNNLAVRREALDAVGGFGELKHSVTEDAELISEVRDQHRWLIRAHTSPRATVHPEPQISLGALLKQGIRWNTGALFAPDPKTRASSGLVMIFLFVSVVVSPLAVVYVPILFLAGGSFISMMLMGVLAGIYARRPARYWTMLLPNVLFSMLFYSLITLLTLLRAKISWKGTTVRR